MQNKVLNLYPIDYPFETLVSRVNGGKLKLNPDFQRKYKWNKVNEEKTSRFIESILMRIPLPACYFAEDEEKKHIVIDGVQRITTVKRFLNDEFALEGLTQLDELNGKRFSELEDLREDMNNYTIRCIILRKDNSKELIKDIFARLNQGAVELTHQEIRHAIYPGKFNDLLIELGKNQIIVDFKGNTKKDELEGSSKKDGLENEEQILRFFAMLGDLADYEGNLTKYLDAFMEENQNACDEVINQYRVLFNDTIDKCTAVFDKEIIFKDTNKQKAKQSMVYYDLIMWSFKDYSIDFVKDNKNEIIKNFKELCEMDELQKTLSGGTQNKGSILRRRKLWKEKLEKIND
ncbi:MAG: DUF262 domain-containing protein [Desulfosporosinus sp.]|nr:DUF262 domain-containing protein [Desulfosporosinus sp.]